MQRQPRSCSNIPSFLQWTAPIACSFCEGCTWHHPHILVKAPLCCDWKGRAACAQSVTLWHQATIKIPHLAHLISACSRHMGVVLHAHPVRGESHMHHNAAHSPQRYLKGCNICSKVEPDFLKWVRVKETSNWENLGTNRALIDLEQDSWGKLDYIF